jgi:hypothetical protein
MTEARRWFDSNSQENQVAERCLLTVLSLEYLVTWCDVYVLHTIAMRELRRDIDQKVYIIILGPSTPKLETHERFGYLPVFSLERSVCTM